MDSGQAFLTGARSTVQPTAMSKMAWQVPTISAARATVASCTTRRRTGPGRAGLSEHAVGVDAHRVEDDRGVLPAGVEATMGSAGRTAGARRRGRCPSSPAVPGSRAATTTSSASIGVEDEVLLAVEHEAVAVGDGAWW